MLELRNITHHWSGPNGQRQPLLRGVSLSVAPGQTVALLGASGSGKSTLLNIITGLETPETGSVWLDGQDISDWPPERRRLALMFQDFALFPHLNLQDNVAFGLVEQGVARTVARSRADGLLQRFGLGGRGRERVGTLSGGEQQRVALARAWAMQPRLLLLDEPTASLDPSAKRDVEQLWAQFLGDAGQAVGAPVSCLFSSHNLGQVKRLASRVIYLERGRVLADLPVGAFFNSDLSQTHPQADLFLKGELR